MTLHYRHDTLYGRPNGREPAAVIAPRLAQDRDPKTPSPRSAFKRAKRLEASYARRLRRVAKHIGDIVREFADGTFEAAILAQSALERYSRALEPWAGAVADRMVKEVAQRDEVSWKRASADIGRALQREIATAPTGNAMRRLMAEQVSLITSLPLYAAQRVHDQTMEGIAKGQRADVIAKTILETGSVTRSRADLIARTETARTASVLTQVRAEHVGCTHYIWRTAKDASVRSSHKRLEGKVIAYSDPPECDPGHFAHAGQIWNCFPGSTEVSLTNGCHHLWRRWYEGSLVVIEHEGGFLELTPNHPVLTSRGWVAACDIQIGDHVIQSLRDRRFALQDNEDQGQPTFRDLFVALESCLDRETHAGFLFDFHGDRPDDHVDAIVADDVLPGYGMTQSFEAICDRTLVGANSVQHTRWISGGLLEISDSDSSGCGNEFGSVVRAHDAHSSDVCLTPVSALNAMAVENAGDDKACAFKTKRYAEFAFTRNVRVDDVALRKVCASVVSRGRAVNDFDPTGAQTLADQIGIVSDCGGGIFDSGSGKYKTLGVVNKSIRQFSDHVYTMQTANGWFPVTSAAIVTKNCRCYQEPVLSQ